MEIPVEIVRDHIIPYCDIKSVVNLMKTCTLYKNIKIWLFLLQRDRNIMFTLCERELAETGYRDIYKIIFKHKTRKYVVVRKDVDSKEVLKFKYPNCGILAVNPNTHPTARKILDILWKDGKLDKTCDSSKSCKCYDCSLKVMKTFTGEI